MSRLGVFYGNFDPPHLGHIGLVDSIIKKKWLDRIYVCGNLGKETVSVFNNTCAILPYPARKLLLNAAFNGHNQVEVIHEDASVFTKELLNDIKRSEEKNHPDDSTTLGIWSHWSCDENSSPNRVVYGIVGSDILQKWMEVGIDPPFGIEKWLICHNCKSHSVTSASALLVEPLTPVWKRPELILFSKSDPVRWNISSSLIRTTCLENPLLYTSSHSNGFNTLATLVPSAVLSVIRSLAFYGDLFDIVTSFVNYVLFDDCSYSSPQLSPKSIESASRSAIDHNQSSGHISSTHIITDDLCQSGTRLNPMLARNLLAAEFDRHAEANRFTVDGDRYPRALSAQSFFLRKMADEYTRRVNDWLEGKLSSTSFGTTTVASSENGSNIGATHLPHLNMDFCDFVYEVATQGTILQDLGLENACDSNWKLLPWGPIFDANSASYTYYPVLVPGPANETETGTRMMVLKFCHSANLRCCLCRKDESGVFVKVFSITEESSSSRISTMLIDDCLQKLSANLRGIIDLISSLSKLTLQTRHRKLWHWPEQFILQACGSRLLMAVPLLGSSNFTIGQLWRKCMNQPALQSTLIATMLKFCDAMLSLHSQPFATGLSFDYDSVKTCTTSNSVATHEVPSQSALSLCLQGNMRSNAIEFDHFYPQTKFEERLEKSKSTLEQVTDKFVEYGRRHDLWPSSTITDDDLSIVASNIKESTRLRWTLGVFTFDDIAIVEHGDDDDVDSVSFLPFSIDNIGISLAELDWASILSLLEGYQRCWPLPTIVFNNLLHLVILFRRSVLSGEKTTSSFANHFLTQYLFSKISSHLQTNSQNLQNMLFTPHVNFAH